MLLAVVTLAAEQAPVASFPSRCFVGAVPRPRRAAGGSRSGRRSVRRSRGRKERSTGGQVDPPAGSATGEPAAGPRCRVTEKKTEVPRGRCVLVRAGRLIGWFHPFAVPKNKDCGGNLAA